MSHKSIVNKIMKEKARPSFAFEFQALIFKEINVPNFFENCKCLAYSVVENGSTITVTDTMLKRRQQLGLPNISSSDKIEIKKLAEATGLCKSLKEEI